MTNLSVAGVVVLFQPTQNVVDNIFSYIKSVKRLFVVDNTENSSAETNRVVEVLKKNPLVDYIALPNNPGIARALNIAFRKAVQEGFQWIISLDQDSSFETNVLTIYEQYIKSNKEELSKIALLSPEYLFERRKYKPLKESKIVDFTMQSASLFNLPVFEKIGPFREDFFLDCVDYDYFCRARKNGYFIVQCAGALLKHNPGITKRKRILFCEYKYGYMSPLRLYYQVRNLLQLSIEYKSLRLVALVCWKLFKVIFFFDSKKSHFKAIYKAVCDFSKHKFGKIQTV